MKQEILSKQTGPLLLRIAKVSAEGSPMNDPVGATPQVAILLCTYQGQRFLQEQLDSFAAQSYPNWELWVSDDGSTDGTHDILERAKGRLGDRMSIHNGPQNGFCANFLSLACKADIQADYYAYSDQEDVWAADKISRALAWLETVPKNAPALYCSRTRYISSEGNELGYSTLFARPPTFRNALVQNIAGANTMIFNQVARELLIQVPVRGDVVAHDWVVYLLVTGCGGHVFYDPHPSVNYRQHESNLTGQNVTIAAKLKRARAVWADRLKHWNTANIKVLHNFRSKLTAEHGATLECFMAARQNSTASRIMNLYRSGVYRQTIVDSIGLFVAVLYKKI